MSFLGPLLKGGIKEGLIDLGERLFSNEISRKGLMSGEAAMKKLGWAGDALVASTKTWREAVDMEKGKYTSEILGALKGKLGDDSVVKDFATHWQNPAAIADPQIKTAVDIGKLKRLDIYSRLQQAGVKTGPLVQDDWPRMYDKELFQGVGRENAIAAMQRGGLSSRDADRLLGQISGKAKKAYNYEAPRKFDLPGYKRDLNVVFDDVTHGLNRLNWAKIFGPNDENLDVLLQSIKETNGESGVQFARQYIDAIAKNGRYYKGASNFEQGLTSLQIASKLSTAVLSNVSQPTNTVLLTGLRPMLKGFGSMVKELVETGGIRSADDFGLQAGSYWLDTRKEFAALYGDEPGKLGYNMLKYTGFSAVERFNRILASKAGQYAADDLFMDLKEGIRPQLATQKLRLLGIDPDEVLKRGFLTKDDYLIAAKRTSDITQFVSDANSLPIAWRSSPHMRVLTQFKSFAFMQGKFIKDYALKPAVEYMASGGARGDIRPLVYMGILFPTVGEAVADMRDLVRKGTLEERPKEFLDRAVDNMGQLGAIGMMEDMIYGLTGPSDRPIWNFITGPTISDAVDITNIVAGRTPLGTELTKRIPIVGPRLAYEQREAKRQAQHQRRQPGKLESGVLTKGLEKLMK